MQSASKLFFLKTRHLECMPARQERRAPLPPTGLLESDSVAGALINYRESVSFYQVGHLWGGEPAIGSIVLTKVNKLHHYTSHQPLQEQLCRLFEQVCPSKHSHAVVKLVVPCFIAIRRPVGGSMAQGGLNLLDVL